MFKLSCWILKEGFVERLVPKRQLMITTFASLLYRLKHDDDTSYWKLLLTLSLAAVPEKVFTDHPSRNARLSAHERIA